MRRCMLCEPVLAQNSFLRRPTLCPTHQTQFVEPLLELGATPAEAWRAVLYAARKLLKEHNEKKWLDKIHDLARIAFDVRRIRTRGDAQDYTRLVEFLFPRLYAKLKRHVQHADAESIAYGAFNKMFLPKKAYLLRDPSGVRPVLFAIARDALIDHFRASARRQEMPPLAIFDHVDHETPDAPLIADETITSALATLCEKERATIEHTCFAKLSHKENARLLKTTSNNSNQYKFRALQKLRDWLRRFQQGAALPQGPQGSSGAVPVFEGTGDLPTDATS
jgi:DNA-directed RNA polymerase specialized sigma24 family protein